MNRHVLKNASWVLARTNKLNPKTLRTYLACRPRNFHEFSQNFLDSSSSLEGRRRGLFEILSNILRVSGANFLLYLTQSFIRQRLELGLKDGGRHDSVRRTTKLCTENPRSYANVCFVQSDFFLENIFPEFPKDASKFVHSIYWLLHKMGTEWSELKGLFRMNRPNARNSLKIWLNLRTEYTGKVRKTFEYDFLISHAFSELCVSYLS